MLKFLLVFLALPAYVCGAAVTFFLYEQSDVLPHLFLQTVALWPILGPGVGLYAFLKTRTKEYQRKKLREQEQDIQRLGRVIEKLTE